MENTESFNLRWDDFEANTRVTLKELREEREFCDVTLACDGRQVSAHKVILAGGSNFFQQILKQNPHPHPLLYLKGVRYDYLLSMLDFVYTGEANINEKELKSFLDVANDLQIKGLIEKNPSRKPSAKQGDTVPSNDSHQNHRSDIEKKAGSPLHAETPSQGNNRGSQSTSEDGPIDTPLDGNIKVERDDTIHPTASFGTEANRAGLNDREAKDMIDLKTEVPDSYGIGSNFTNEQVTADWYEQNEDFFDDASRPNSGKLAPAFTSQDQLLACQQKSDLPLHQFEFSGPYFNSSIVKSKCEENHDRNQVLVDDYVKTKPGVTSSFYFNLEEDSYVETDDFLRGVDNNQVFPDCDLTGREPADSVSESEKNANCSYKEGDKSDVSVRHDEEPGDNRNDKEFSTMTKGRKICSVCGRSCRDSSDLKIHTRIHTGEKPFPCVFCPKTFRLSHNLKEHTRVHTGEKPFMCLVCFKRFTQSSALNAHKKQNRCSMKVGE